MEWWFMLALKAGVALLACAAVVVVLVVVVLIITMALGAVIAKRVVNEVKDAPVVFRAETREELRERQLRGRR